MGKYVTNAGLTEYRRLDKIEKDGIRASMIAPADVNAIAGQITLAPSLHEFVRRASPALCDGVYKVKTIRGKSLVWNQLVKNGTFSEGALNWSSVASVSDGVAQSITLNRYSSMYQDLPTLAGHKYLIRAMVKGAESGTALIGTFSGGSLVAGVQKAVNTSTFTEIVGVISPASNGAIIGIAAWSGQQTFYVKDVTLTDLTRLFESGNEPTTYADFLKRKPIVEDEYTFDEGTIINNKVEKVVSADTDGAEVGVLDLSWISEIKDENGVALFEDGMRSAGSAYDEVGASKATKRIIKYTFKGNESWNYGGDSAHRWTATIRNPLGATLANSLNILQNISASLTPTNVTYGTSDKIYIYTGTTDGNLYFQISCGSFLTKDMTIEQINAMLVGKTAYLELATPIEVEYDEKQMFSPAFKGGMEYIVAEGNTTPIPMEAGYPLDLRSLFVSAQSEE